MRKRKKKWWLIVLIVIGVLATFGVIGLSIYGCIWFMLPTPKWKRQRMVEYYRSGIGCTVIEAYITEDDLSFEDGILKISFNEAKIIKEGYDVYWETYEGICEVDEAGIAKLQENNFFEAVKNGAMITVSIDFKIWWDGWRDYPIMEIKIGDKVYLDNETAVEEFFDWILNEMY